MTPTPQPGEFWLVHTGDDHYFIGQVERVDENGTVWGHWCGTWRSLERDTWTWGWMFIPEMVVQVMAP